MRSKSFFFPLLTLAVGLVAGKEFPDLDQDVSFLVHRSIFTHGLLLPVMLFSVAFAFKATPVRLFAIGFSLGVAVHLSFDLFPKAWTGFALIHVPTVGWTYPAVSWVWIALSIVVCLYAAMKLVRNGAQGVALVLGTLGVFIYAGSSEDALLGPFVVMIAGVAVGAIALLWSSIA